MMEESTFFNPALLGAHSQFCLLGAPGHLKTNETGN